MIMAFAYQPLLGPVGVGGALSVNADVGTCQTVGGAVAVCAQRRCHANVGEVFLANQNVRCGRQKTVAADVGNLEFVSLEYKIVRAMALAIGIGNITISGPTSVPKAARRCIADKAEIATSAPSVENRRYRPFSPLDATVAFVATSEQSCGFLRAWRLLASEGVITVNGKSATVYRDHMGGGGTPPGGAPATASISIAIGL
jgi:hypothetical protein